MMKIKFLLFILAIWPISLNFAQEKDEVKPVFYNFLDPLPNLRDFTLDKSGEECYFTLLSPEEEIGVIMGCRKREDKWGVPFIPPFSGKFKDLEPFLSPDGKKLFFASNRPLLENEQNPGDFNIWYVQRPHKNATWSKPLPLEGPVNTEQDEFFPSVCENNNLYFTSNGESSKGLDDIFVSKWNKDHYEAPESLAETINTKGYEFNAFIAPDESFILFSGYNRPDGFGSGDLYISFKDQQGNWEPARNLGKEINSKKLDYCPFFHFESSTLYFTSKRSHWDNAPSSTLSQLLKKVNQYENGFSRIYSVYLPALLSNKK